MALALDSTTQLEQRAAPEGILYTGGRDGQVISWDLGFSFRKRRAQPHRHPNRWERLTSMDDETWDDNAEEEEERRDGDILGDVKESGARRWKDKSNKGGEVPYEHQWELDVDAHEFPLRPQFRQCVQLHTDWINDILLCNYNQTVISASSDGTVKSWSPHAGTFTEPSTIGFHADYVRCLALSRERNWVASGSFDRTIKLWDLTRTSSIPEPLLTLNPPDLAASKASVYSLAVDPCGHVVASGSPERVVRMWDPRAGKRIGKLVGHTDNIRAILISEDSRYLLTGSADGSIKLWSLASQHCLYTFTYHTDSVWALHSSHPSLEVFYSGDKSGIVCKVDVEDCGDVSDGVCIVLSRESSGETGDGVNKIVTADDGLLWTACGSSTVSRWKLPRRVHRRSMEDSGKPAADPLTTVGRRKRVSLGTDSIWLPSSPCHSPSDKGRKDEISSYPGVPWTALVQLTSPNGPYSSSSFVTKAHDAEVATLYSAASIVSVPGGSSVFGTSFQQPSTIPPSGMLRSMRSLASVSNTDHDLSHDIRALHEIPEIAPDAEPYNVAPESVMPGSRGLVRAILLNDRMHALTVDTKGEVAVWDIVRGICRGNYTREDVRAASRCGSTNGSALSKGSGSALGERDRSPREALEVVRERIEGEAVISSWSSVDTKAGVLTVHINERCFEAEIYADEAGFELNLSNDDQRINIGKWVLRNLFLGFIREEQRIRRRREGNVPDSNFVAYTNPHRDPVPTHVDIHRDTSSSTGRNSSSEVSCRSSPRTAISTVVFTSPYAAPAIIPSVPTITKALPLLPSMIPLATSNACQSQVPVAQTHTLSSDRTPVPIQTHGLDAPPLQSATRDGDYFTFRSQHPSAANVVAAASELPGSSGPSSPTKMGPDSPTSATPNTPNMGGFMGLFKSFGKVPGRKSITEATPGSPVVGSTGKDTPTLSEEHGVKLAKTPAQILLSNPLSPPSSSEVPTLALPPNMTVMISDEYYPGWRTVYRTSVSNMSDTYTLEETLPLWLLEYLLMNRAPPPPNVKLSFVLLPWPNLEPGGEQLPELLNSAQSKLTASRFLRVRKLAHHVQEKLEKLSGQPGSPALSLSHLELTTPNRQHRARAEEVYEILCNDSVLPLDMTLGAVRHYFWRQSSELVMHYRLRKRQSTYGDTNVSVHQ
ncbi:hypothetical protein EDD16DRAFT_1764042 [Pisolithus croceorrhizus]|nr:hypothetical protein EDD16DRAFT_1764042 [Pisolithus croceorrhizus]